MEGRKDDTGKTPYELLPYWYLEGTARILAFGAGKYDAWNWYKGMAWGRVFGALMRHLWSWWWAHVRGVGAAIDRETGMSHLWHAGCCLAFLMQYEAEGIGQDDRPRRLEVPNRADRDTTGGPGTGVVSDPFSLLSKT